VALVFAAAIFLAIGQGLKRFIAAGIAGGDRAALDRGLFLMLSVVVILSISTYTRFYFVSWLGERVVAGGARCSTGCSSSRLPGTRGSAPAPAR